MKAIAASMTYINKHDQKVVVEVQAPGTVYFESWANGYKQYFEVQGESVLNDPGELIFENFGLTGFDDDEISNFIHYSGCFYEN